MSQQMQKLCAPATLYEAWNYVKGKGAAGGIDGVSLAEFDQNRVPQIATLSEELRTGQWRPQPYWQISIPKSKSPNERRVLGMAVVRDKVVQQALRAMIEPRCERLFVPNSYAYRPKRGALRAIRYTLSHCANKRFTHALRLDVDNYFDNIDHELLRQRLTAIGLDNEVVRLVMLSVSIGRVDRRKGQWAQPDKGVPQGAVLSPLMANLYLHSFDQFAVSRGLPYVRYADDLLFLCEGEPQAEEMRAKANLFLNDRLKLQLNDEQPITTLDEGFDFLGITIKGRAATLSEAKRQELEASVMALEFGSDGFAPRSQKAWQGMSQYYAHLLPQADLEQLDDALIRRISDLIDGGNTFASKTALSAALSSITFLSQSHRQQQKQHLADLTGRMLIAKNNDQQALDQKKNRQIIQSRKQEYRRLETESSGLVVNKPGAFIGLTSRGITVSHKGKALGYYPKDNLAQIVVTGAGVSMSSNLIAHCLNNRIPIDFFDAHGVHLGAVVSARSLQNSLWRQQATADEQQRHSLAAAIIEGKIKNQLGLLKYFHKYHKGRYPNLQDKMERAAAQSELFKQFKKDTPLDSPDYMTLLVGHEAQVAVRYWDYLRELLADDGTGFERREHQGATDLVNCMLNYGYAILYAQVWQALLAAQLNPFESLIHARQSGKPTLVYDMVELFRSQVVDRVVVGLIQKGQDVEVSEGRLTDKTRGLLAKGVVDRLQRYERWQGEEMRMAQIILRQAKDLAKAFAENTKFKPYVAKW